MKKVTYQKVIRMLDGIATQRAALPVKRMMADADGYEPPPKPKRARKTRNKKSSRLGRFGPGGLTQLLSESTRHLKALDPRTEWETGVALLGEEYHAIRRGSTSTTTNESKPRRGGSRRRRTPRSRTRSRTAAKRAR